MTEQNKPKCRNTFYPHCISKCTAALNVHGRHHQTAGYMHVSVHGELSRRHCGLAGGCGKIWITTVVGLSISSLRGGGGFGRQIFIHTFSNTREFWQPLQIIVLMPCAGFGTGTQVVRFPCGGGWPCVDLKFSPSVGWMPAQRWSRQPTGSWIIGRDWRGLSDSGLLRRALHVARRLSWTPLQSWKKRRGPQVRGELLNTATASSAANWDKEVAPLFASRHPGYKFSAIDLCGAGDEMGLSRCRPIDIRNLSILMCSVTYVANNIPPPKGRPHTIQKTCCFYSPMIPSYSLLYVQLTLRDAFN